MDWIDPKPLAERAKVIRHNDPTSEAAAAAFRALRAIQRGQVEAASYWLQRAEELMS